jgi:hypothetical protein
LGVLWGREKGLIELNRKERKKRSACFELNKRRRGGERGESQKMDLVVVVVVEHWRQKGREEG